MVNTSKGNREKIFDTAVKLFAEKGYSNVSMREIAKVVGIKASSIYNHYKGKEKILEEIFSYFKENVTSGILKPLLNEDAEKYENPEKFLYESLRTSMKIFDEPVMAGIIGIIRREQFVNDRFGRFMSEIFIDTPISIFEEVFQKMMNKGLIKPMDARFLAEEYMSFSIYLFYKGTICKQDYNLEIADEERRLRRHVEFLWNNISIK